MRDRAGELGLSAEDSKAAKFHAVAGAVVDVLLVGSPLTVSRLARRAGVSRAWVYKYVGTSPDELVQYSARLFGGAFAELARSPAAERPEDWVAQVAEATRRGFADVRAAPWLVLLYFRFRHDPGTLGETIRDLERRHQEELLQGIPASLRRDRRRAERFVALFDAARLGVWFRWADARFGGDVEEDARWLDALVQAFVQAAR